MSGTLGASPLGALALGAAADDGSQTLVANAVAANWQARAATVVAGAITLNANAVAANWQPQTAALILLLNADAIAANWQPQPASLSAGAVTVAANAVAANWQARGAMLTVEGGNITLNANAVAANWQPRAAAVLPGGVTLFANVLSTYSVQPATLIMSNVTLLSGAAVAANWRARSAFITAVAPVCSRALAPITVACVLENVARKIGLLPDRYDFTAAEVKEVTGFVIAQRLSAASAVADLLRAYDTFLYEADGKLKAGVYGSSVLGTIDEGELGAHFFGEGDAGKAPVEVKRLDDLELPSGGDITYFDPDKDYEQAQQGSERFTKRHIQERVTFSPPLVLTADEARQMIERMVYRQWVEREQFAFSLGPKFLKATPGDVYTVPVLDTTARVRFMGFDIALFGPLQVSAVLDDVDILTQTASGAAAAGDTDEVGFAEVTVLHAWSSPALRDQDASANTVGFYAAAGPDGEGDWTGCQIYWSRDGGSTYEPLDSIEDPSEFGVAATVLAAPPGSVGTAIWDTTSTVDVTMTRGAPVAATDMEVLNGANRAMVGDELVGFVEVTALGPDQYRLSRLLRGQRGTDPYWGTHAIGERFVLVELGGAAIRVEVGSDLIGKAIKLKGVTFGTDLASAPVVDLTITGDELRPYSGADLRGARDLSSNLTVTWHRRTRYGGAWADLMDVPLGETSEQYEADIYDTGFTTLKRTITGLTDETFVYSAADQTTDFGSPQAAIGIRVYQLGAIGRGFKLEGVV
jgi:hypothetical protein